MELDRRESSWNVCLCSQHEPSIQHHAHIAQELSKTETHDSAAKGAHVPHRVARWSSFTAACVRTCCPRWNQVALHMHTPEALALSPNRC